MYGIREAPEVSLESLMHAVLPAPPPDELDLVCGRLVSNGSITGSSEDPRWKCLPENPDDAAYNPGMFKFLEKIVLAVTDSSSKKFTSDLKFQVAQEGIALGSRHDSSHPDGFFYLGDQREPSKVSWTDIIMPMEFTSADDECDKIYDHAKVLWSMHHIMRNDARRGFVYGLTCENTKVRLWYHDRSDVVAAERFDINKDWRHIVHIVLSMLLAPPDRLGFDPDVVLLPSDDPNTEPNYDITVRNSDTKETTTYRTLEIMSDFETDRIIGPGTRAWKVRKLVDGKLDGPCYVLKDTWVHEDCVMEHELLKKIREAQPAYSQHFLTPLSYGFASSNGNTHDNTHKTLRRTELIPTHNVLLTYSSFITKCGDQRALDLSRDRATSPAYMSKRRLQGCQDLYCLSNYPLQHYRIIFEEFGMPVHELRDWGDAFISIKGGLEGVYAMHISGYVHRDISSSNILLVPASGLLGKRGVITDLKYARNIDDTRPPHDMKTSAERFTATEVAFMEYFRYLELDLEQLSSPDTVEPNSLPPFSHNPLHDIESIWWLSIWMMFYLIPVGHDIDLQVENYHKVFCTTMARHSFVRSRAAYKLWTTHLSTTPAFVSIMKDWSTVLNDLYEKSYMQHASSKTPWAKIRIDKKTIEAAYDNGRKFLTQLEEASRSLSATLVSVPEQSTPEPSASEPLTPETSNSNHSATTDQQLDNGPRAKFNVRKASFLLKFTKGRKVGPSTKTRQRDRSTKKPTKQRERGGLLQRIKQRRDKLSAATVSRRLSKLSGDQLG
ncbi:kinase domain protein [Rhizoctonia solani 123E]|uniref:Kinase domain protein n=1 Tax=Rhizoctonia solani 123E TaxID=1423351 RepID=A0A074S7E7_9AGAM|nr:kinase domain protein [Rhizoctonia solani 123E]